MTERQIAIIKAMQGGLRVTEEPFEEIAAQAGISVDDLLAQLQQWQADGTIRRFGAILRHHKAGYNSNAMVVWNVPNEKIERFAAVAVLFSNVSHCYQRTMFEDFPYNLYTMVHGNEKSHCVTTVHAIAEQTRIQDYKMLYTETEFKKSSPVYFESTNAAGAND